MRETKVEYSCKYSTKMVLELVSSAKLTRTGTVTFAAPNRFK